MKNTGDLTEQRKRIILYLRFVEGLTLEQIGKVVGLTRERIRQLIKRDLTERKISV